MHSSNLPPKGNGKGMGRPLHTSYKIIGINTKKHYKNNLHCNQQSQQFIRNNGIVESIDNLPKLDKQQDDSIYWSEYRRKYENTIKEKMELDRMQLRDQRDYLVSKEYYGQIYSPNQNVNYKSLDHVSQDARKQ